jgi:uncharacterized protein
MRKLHYLLIICLSLLVFHVHAVEEDNAPGLQQQEHQPQNSNFVPNYSQVFTTDIYHLDTDVLGQNVNDAQLTKALYDKKLGAVKAYRVDRLDEELMNFLGIEDERERVKIIGRVGTAFAAAGAAYFSGFLLSGFTLEAGFRITDAFADIIAGPGIDPKRIDILREKIEAWGNGILTEKIYKSECNYIIAKYHDTVPEYIQEAIERVLIEARHIESLRYDPIKFVHDALKMPQRAKWLPPESSFDAASFGSSLHALFEHALKGHSILSDYPDKLKQEFKAILQGMSACARNDYNVGNDQHMLTLRKRYTFYGDPGIGNKKAPEAIAKALNIPCHYFSPGSLHDDDVYGTERYVENPKQGELTKAFLQHDESCKNIILVMDLDELSRHGGDLLNFIHTLFDKEKFHSPFFNCDIDLSNMHIIFTAEEYAELHFDEYAEIIDICDANIEFTDLPVDTKRRLLRRYLDINNVVENGLAQHGVVSKDNIINLVMRYKSYLPFNKITQFANKLANSKWDEWDDILGVYKPSSYKIVSTKLGLKHVDGFIIKGGNIYRCRLDGGIEEYSDENPIGFNLSLDGEWPLDTEILGIDSEHDLNGKRFITHKVELLESPYVYYKYENTIHKFYLVRMRRVTGVLKPDIPGGGDKNSWEIVEFNYAEKTRHQLGKPYDMKNSMVPLADEGLYHVAMDGPNIKLVGLDKAFKRTNQTRLIDVKLLDHLKVDSAVSTFEGLYDQLLMPYLRILDFRAFELGAKEIAFLKEYFSKPPLQQDLRAVCLDGDGMASLLALISHLPELRKLIMTNGDLSLYCLESLKRIARHPKLVHLDLRGNSALNMLCLKAFFPLLEAHNSGTKPLKFFSLWGMQVGYNHYHEKYEDDKLKRVTCRPYTDVDPITIVLARTVQNTLEIITKAEAFMNLGNYYSSSEMGRDYKKARDYYEIAAAKGHYMGKYKLAEMLETENGGPKDIERAQQLYKESCDGRDFAQGKYKYGMMLLESDPVRARIWIQQAAEKYHVHANYKIIDLYLEGIGGERDVVEAKKWSRRHASWLCALDSTIFDYAKKCHKGIDWDVDLEDAETFYKKAADMGHIEAQYQYAYQSMLLYHVDAMLIAGFQNIKHSRNAREYFKKAADGGHKDAAYQYAAMCSSGFGHGYQKDNIKAREYYLKAADKEDIEAQYQYAFMCKEGEGGDKDEKKAREYFLKSADKEHKEAQYQYASMCQTGKGGDKSEAEAREYFGKAAEKGYEDAYAKYADMCLKGQGGPDDLEEALKFYKQSNEKYRLAEGYVLIAAIEGSLHLPTTSIRANYKKAADMGHDQAQFEYAKMCYYGWGGTSNMTVSREYIEKAARQGNSDAKKWQKDSECKIM